MQKKTLIIHFLFFFKALILFIVKDREYPNIKQPNFWVYEFDKLSLIFLTVINYILVILYACFLDPKFGQGVVLYIFIFTFILFFILIFYFYLTFFIILFCLFLFDFTVFDILI